MHIFFLFFFSIRFSSCFLCGGKLFKVTLTDNPRHSFVVMMLLMRRVDVGEKGVARGIYPTAKQTLSLDSSTMNVLHVALQGWQAAKNFAATGALHVALLFPKSGCYSSTAASNSAVIKMTARHNKKQEQQLIVLSNPIIKTDGFIFFFYTKAVFLIQMYEMDSMKSFWF